MLHTHCENGLHTRIEDNVFPHPKVHLQQRYCNIKLKLYRLLKNVLLCSHVFFLQMKTFKYKICIDNLLFEPSDWLRTKVLKMSHAD